MINEIKKFLNKNIKQLEKMLDDAEKSEYYLIDERTEIFFEGKLEALKLINNYIDDLEIQSRK